MIFLFNMFFFGIFGCSNSIPPLNWNGYLYLENADGFDPLPNGTMTLYDRNGAFLMDSTQPYSGTAHYHNFALTEDLLGLEISLFIQSPNTYPIVWNGTIPNASSSWLSGALFAPEEIFIQEYFANFDVNDNIQWNDTAVQLWGQPLIPEDWKDIAISVIDGNGETVEVYSFAQVDNFITNDTSSGIQWFFAWNISPGNIEVTITNLSTNDSVSTTYPTEGGEIISALFYALPENWLNPSQE